VAEAVANELIAARVRRGLASRLLAPQLMAQLAHVVALAGLVALLWGKVPERLLIGWAGAVLLATAARAAVTGWAHRRHPPLESLQRALRVVMAAIGLAWGLGAAALLGHMPTADGILLLAVFGTFVAGAAATLVADPLAFRLYTLCLLVPQATGMVILAQDRGYLIAAILTLGLVVFMIAFNAEAYRAFVEHLGTTAALEDALGNVKTLTGLLPICASCKKIRDDRGYWNQIEVYVRDHSEADFSHGLCPDCVRRLYPDFANDST
jgi:hypothetical protein